MNPLQASGIRHRYGTFELNVDQIELTSGKVTCIMGRTGSGKSTLVRILGCLERPQHGVVQHAGGKHDLVTALQKAIMWQGSVQENVEYGMKVRRIGKRQRRSRAEDALDALDIYELASHDVRTLSGGQTQKVALARAIVLDPEVLLLDEPLAHIDQESARTIATTLKTFTSRTGCATGWVTHEVNEALGVSDYLAVMDDGRMMQSGQTLDVARLLGGHNIIPAKIESCVGGLATAAVNDHRFEVVTDLVAATEVFLLVRPEELTLSQDQQPGSSPRNHFEATVTEVTWHGAVATIHLKNDFSVTAVVTRPALEELGIILGTQLWVNFKATATSVIPRS
ncbi:MAG: ABC transporter ATP-binding protein [Actinomycetota bacterium]